MRSTKRKIVLALLPTVLIMVPLCLGMMIGYTFANRDLRKDFAAVAKSENRLVWESTARRSDMAQAYDDPKTAEVSMSNYCYNVATVMTPFVGVAPEPGQHKNAFINSLQCRSDNEVSLPKPPRTFRIFVTGGSVAFSSGAPGQDKTIGSYLNAILEKELSAQTGFHYEVFTLATPAWASTQERIIIENRILDLQPDLVISFSGNNDVHWGMLGRNVLWYRTNQEEFNWHVLNWNYQKFGLGPMTDIVPVDPHPIAPSLVAERLERNVRLCAFALGTKNIPYVFCLQPTLAVTKKPLQAGEQLSLTGLNPADKSISGSNYFLQCYAKIDAKLSTFKSGNFTYVNLSGVFDNMTTPDRMFIDCYHFGDKGNALIARALFNGVRGLLASPQVSTTRSTGQLKINIATSH